MFQIYKSEIEINAVLKMEDFVIKKYDELSIDELYAILKLRAKVFVVEQNCAYLDLDDYDQKSLHISIYNSGQLVAYARLLPPGVYYEETSIGRVITAKEVRMTGVGKRVFEKSLDLAKEQFPDHNIRIMAQCYLRKFYQDFGFKEEGEEFLEDGLPHIEMVKVL